MKKKTVILSIIDGFGINHEKYFNAIKHASTPNLCSIEADSLVTNLDASGINIGLPNAQMGNSEVGHSTIGAGRVIMQDLPKINKAFETYTIFDNPNLIEFIDKLNRTKGVCHLMGLASDGGVHAHIDHIIKLAIFIANNDIPVYIHAFTDGRDTALISAKNYIAQLLDLSATHKNISLISITGRFYAMDRDKKWERTKEAFDAIIYGDAESHSDDFLEVIDKYYECKIYDEFIPPTIKPSYKGIKPEDGIFFANFRADRMRQIVAPIVFEDFNGFSLSGKISIAAKISLTQYSSETAKKMPTIFSDIKIENTLGKYLSDHNLKQLRLAETEKYAHVTYFFNGGVEEVYPGEDRVLVKSPSVKTYDLQPEMSIDEVTSIACQAISENKYDLIVINFANCDMVGHTGNFTASVKAVEYVDEAIGKICAVIDKENHSLIITSDHGNVENMRDPNDQPQTSHTTNQVPFILYNNLLKYDHIIEEGTLADIAPTILYLLGLSQPLEMTGKNLLNKRD